MGLHCDSGFARNLLRIAAIIPNLTYTEKLNKYNVPACKSVDTDRLLPLTFGFSAVVNSFNKLCASVRREGRFCALCLFAFIVISAVASQNEATACSIEYSRIAHNVMLPENISVAHVSADIEVDSFAAGARESIPFLGRLQDECIRPKVLSHVVWSGNDTAGKLCRSSSNAPVWINRRWEVSPKIESIKMLCKDGRRPSDVQERIIKTTVCFPAHNTVSRDVKATVDFVKVK